MSNAHEAAMRDLAHSLGMTEGKFSERYLLEAAFHFVCDKAVAEHIRAERLEARNAGALAKLRAAFLQPTHALLELRIKEAADLLRYGPKQSECDYELARTDRGHCVCDHDGWCAVQDADELVKP